MTTIKDLAAKWRTHPVAIAEVGGFVNPYDQPLDENTIAAFRPRWIEHLEAKHAAYQQAGWDEELDSVEEQLAAAREGTP